MAGLDFDAIDLSTLDQVIPNAKAFFESLGLIPTQEHCRDNPRKCPIASCRAPMRVEINSTMKAGFLWRCTSGKCGDTANCRSCSGRAGTVKNYPCRCRQTANPYEGTFFERTRLEFSQVLRIIVCFVTRASFDETLAAAGVSTSTLVNWNQFCRDVCAMCIRGEKVGGPGLEVEVDEVHLYVKKYPNGPGRDLVSQHVWAVGVLCRETGEIAIERTAIRSADVLRWFLRDHVEPLSLIISDQWRGYKNLLELGDTEGFGDGDSYPMMGHFALNHSEVYSQSARIQCVPEPEGIMRLSEWLYVEVNTNHIERKWRETRKHVRCVKEKKVAEGYVSSFLVSYLDAFVYFNNKLYLAAKQLKIPRTRVRQRNALYLKTFLKSVVSAFAAVGGPRPLPPDETPGDVIDVRVEWQLEDWDELLRGLSDVSSDSD